VLVEGEHSLSKSGVAYCGGIWRGYEKVDQILKPFKGV